jgi:hypothetical protein
MQIKNSLDQVTRSKILRGAMIAGAGAILTYLGEYFSSVDLGSYTLLVGAVMSVLVNVVKEYRSGME